MCLICTVDLEGHRVFQLERLASSRVMLRCTHIRIPDFHWQWSFFDGLEHDRRRPIPGIKEKLLARGRLSLLVMIVDSPLL